MPSISAISRTLSGPMGLEKGVTGDGLLVETMQLVEPRKSEPVPNHILETKIYSKVAQNSMVAAKPAVIHFGGFEVDKKQVQKLNIVNASTEVIRMHIIPPQTKYFYIKYSKHERLVPGLNLECTIEFTPDEWRYYYDCIRINCPGEDNLVIPIHAYPVMSAKNFPQQFNFPPVPVGHKTTKVFPLHCDAPIDFEFQVTYINPHPSFSVEPMTGIIPAHGMAEVEVTFAPLEFQTALMKLQLVISQFNSSPIICNFSGTSVPGLLKDLTQGHYPDTEYVVKEIVLDPRSLTPLGRARRKKMSKKLEKEESMSQELEYAGVKFPPNLETPYAVAQVLNQEPGKLRAKDIRETLLTKKDAKPKKATRQMKEAMFEHKVRQNVYEERQNQLRWQSKLGDDQITNSDRAKILAARNEAWNEYKFKRRGDPIAEDEYHRHETGLTFKRTFREASEEAAEIAKFDTYTNNMWSTRHSTLNRFAQAARKVIIHMRVNEKLKSLRKMVDDWRKQKYYTGIVSNDQVEKIEEEERKELIPANLPLEAEKIKKYQFPTYAPPNVKDDMREKLDFLFVDIEAEIKKAPDALGKVPFKQMDVVVKRKVPYFNLKVPQQYSLMGYQTHNVHNAGSGYVAPKLARPLRTGAEDEVINLPSSMIEPAVKASVTAETMEEGEITPSDSVEEATQKEEKVSPKQVMEPVALTPPKALFQPIEYPPLHIFNPAPGLQVFQSPMPYGEVDSDFHLCPLPRYFRKDHATNPHAATQRKYLDREDVIRGIMTWKKFPSQGLTSLSNTPTLTNVWVPRWDDPFGSEVLPQGVPQLLDNLPDDDKQNIIDETEEGGDDTDLSVILTPDMVNAQFPVVDPTTPPDDKPSGDQFPHGNKLPATNIPVSSYGPVPREKREEELEFFMNKKYNRLGLKLQNRTNNLNNLITDPNLVLK